MLLIQSNRALKLLTGKIFSLWFWLLLQYVTVRRISAVGTNSFELGNHCFPNNTGHTYNTFCPISVSTFGK